MFIDLCIMSKESQPQRRGITMMKTVILIGFALSFSATVQASPSVLVYHDVADGYGDAILTAIDNLWPACTADIYTGLPEQSGFNNALMQGSWDVVILECWHAQTNGIDWYEVKDMYLNEEAEFFVYNWFWYGSSAGQFQLFQAMGIEDLAVSSYNDSMGVCDPSHPIVQGISDWSQYLIFPGGGGSVIRQIKFLCGNAYPVTGWYPSHPTYEFGGICVAVDGKSIVSGFCPAYAVEAVAIWENILNFLWDGSPLQQSTWGQIKADFAVDRSNYCHQ